MNAIAGLSTTEAQRRLRQQGANALPEQPPRPLWQRFLRQFQSPLIYILIFALAVDLIIWISAGLPGLPHRIKTLVVLSPRLRTVLDLALPNGEILLWIGATVALSWLVAEATSRGVHPA